MNEENTTDNYDEWFQAKVNEVIKETGDSIDPDDAIDQITDVLEVKRGRGRPRKIRPEDLIKAVDDYDFPTFETHRISAIFNECMKSSNRQAIVDFLNRHKTQPMLDIFRLIYDRDIRFNVDTTELPGQTKPGHGFIPIIKIIRNMGYLIRDEDVSVDKAIRERILYTMFDEIVSEDYHLLCKIFKKQPLPNIPKDVAEAVAGTKY